MAMNCWRRGDETGERKWSENDGDQHPMRHFLYCPKRRNVGGVKHLLRGKIPGNPG